jgi:hypothetical protein
MLLRDSQDFSRPHDSLSAAGISGARPRSTHAGKIALASVLCRTRVDYQLTRSDMCRRLKTSELIRSNSNAWTEVDAEASLARFPIVTAAACSDSASTRHARVRRSVAALPIVTGQPVLQHSASGHMRKRRVTFQTFADAFCDVNRAGVLGRDEATDVGAVEFRERVLDASLHGFRRVATAPRVRLQRPSDLQVRPPFRFPRTGARGSADIAANASKSASVNGRSINRSVSMRFFTGR